MATQAKTTAKTTTTTTTTTPKSTTAAPVPATDSVTNIGKTIEEHTPKFISTKIIWTANELESFRTGAFNSKIIFYPLLLLLLFFILRFIWRKIY